MSGLNHCRYCHAVHTATAERLGAAVALAGSLLKSLEHPALPERLRPVLRYAPKLTRDPASIAHADAAAILAAETALYHTVAVIALFNFMNRLVEGLGIEHDVAYAQGAGKRLAERGYLPLLSMMRP